MLFIDRLFRFERDGGRKDTDKGRFVRKLCDRDLLKIDRKRIEHTELEVQISRTVLCGDDSRDLVLTRLDRELLHVAELYVSGNVGNKGVCNSVIVSGDRRIVGFELDMPCLSVGFCRGDTVFSVNHPGSSRNGVAFKLHTEQFSLGDGLFLRVKMDIVLQIAHWLSVGRYALIRCGRCPAAARAYEQQSQ